MPTLCLERRNGNAHMVVVPPFLVLPTISLPVDFSETMRVRIANGEEIPMLMSDPIIFDCTGFEEKGEWFLYKERIAPKARRKGGER